MEVICISDNLETAIGLRFSGINTVVINNREEINNKLEFMQELANRFPTKDDAVTEIINLNAILALPRGPEHFMSDLHGQADAFTHILNNSAGGINNYLETIIKENKIGIVVVTKKIYELCKEKIEQICNNSKLPLIVNIP